MIHATTNSTFFCLVCWLLLIQSIKGQTIQFKPLFEVSIPNQYFTTDKLQQTYVLTPENELVKYSLKGVEQFRYNENAYGEITHIDATNPLQILVYYGDFLKVVILDRTLSPTSEYSLLDLDLVQVSALGMSNSNTLWLYDELDFKLKKIDQQGDVIRQSDNLALYFSQELQPNFLIERNNQIYLNEPSLGILVFDRFGNYLNTIEIKDLAHFQIIENQIFYLKENKLQAYHLRTFTTTSFDLPMENVENFRVEKNQLFLRVADKIGVFIF